MDLDEWAAKYLMLFDRKRLFENTFSSDETGVQERAFLEEMWRAHPNASNAEVLNMLRNRIGRARDI